MFLAKREHYDRGTFGARELADVFFCGCGFCA
jgi:hypothetical protein